MDETEQSRVSDSAAAASRKRRSSILKSQRPSRTPFSELEFNVATPTDTAKSRRVSFSRRTGVAEFVTNEATTTWKTFYEEHNKSLESSGNDSEANALRQPVGHLGKRIFDQQFEEVEAVDFISGFANDSLNNDNFSQQLASLECTGEGKLTAPHNKFELSAFTEQSKLFGNDFTAPSIGENSGRIDVNFSAIQQVKKDDLDEIEKELGRGSHVMGCYGPFSNGHDMSEYIEIDLNVTQVVKNDEDMSITDTVHSPVQDISKSTSIDKKVSLNNDWAADKENIAINPYAAPCESNFTVNEEADQVLVFDGKRLTLQPDIPEKDINYRQTLLPNSSAETPQRKTIVLNVNDDLPNFIDVQLNSKCENFVYNGFQEMKMDEDKISDIVRDIKPNRKTIHDNTGNISMTQALPANIICQTAAVSHDANATKRRTIVFNESTSNISVTETVPVKLLCISGTIPERRRTLVFEDDTCNISITQAVPSNILVNDDIGTTNKHKTIVFDSGEDNISVTKAISSNIFDEACKRKSIVSDIDDAGINMSLTLGRPASIMLPDKPTQEKRRTVIYKNDTGDMSVTQAISTNVILPNNEPNPERRRTVVYEDDTANISITQALPSNILQEIVQLDGNKENNEANFAITQSLPNNITDKNSDASRRRTIVYENDTGNISITQAIPTQLIPGYCEDKPLDAFNTSIKPRNKKRTTILYDNDEGDISMTEVIPANIIKEATNERKTIAYDEVEANIASTLAISTNVFLLDKLDSAEDCEAKNPEGIKEEKEKVPDYKVYEQDALNSTGTGLQDNQTSFVFNAEDCNSDISMIMAIPKAEIIRETEKRKTVIFNNENCDLSMTKPIPAELISFGIELLHTSKNIVLDPTEPDQGANPQSDVIVLQASTTNSKPCLHSSTTEQGDLKNTKDICRNMISDTKASSINVTDEVTPSPVEDVSADASLLHPRLEQKLNQLNLINSSSETNVDKVSEGEDVALIQTDSEEKNTSLLPSLLSMSATSVDSGTADKNFMAHIDSNPSSDNLKRETDDNTSNESMFYITKESDYDTQTERDVDNKATRAKPKELTYNHSPLQIEYKEEKPVQIDDLQMKLADRKTACSENNDFSNREQPVRKVLEKVVSSDLEDVVEKDDTVKYTKEGHNFKNADDTQELLDMISSVTNSRYGEDEVDPAVKLKCNRDGLEYKRLSFATNRQSIALSREDLFNNISMAQAALQSRLSLGDSVSLEENTRDESVEISKNSGRTSNDVVKTLQFDDDESFSDTRYSPLKKTAFGETSYMNETKGKVIPTYLKDVSEGIKELMVDLVKPRNDTLPFESVVDDKGVTKIPSTQSTHVQANLVSSSQVDLDCELLCNTDTNADTEKGSSLPAALKKSRSRSLRSPVKFSGVNSGISSEFDVPDLKQSYLQSPSHNPVDSAPPDVLVFDHQNPLNNILLAPINCSDVHRYNPKKSDDTLCGNEPSDSHLNKSSRGNDYEMEPVTTTQYRMATTMKAMQEDVSVYKQQDDQFSTQSTSTSRPISIDQTKDFSTQLKDDQVNTMIAMRENKELLETSSSLTLVDDALGDEGRPMSPHENQRVKFSRSNLVDIEEQAAEIDNIAKSQESALIERIDSSNLLANRTKGKKRIYSPVTDKYKEHQPNMEVTPKPNKKIQKISNSPNPNKVTVVSKVRSKDIALPSRSTNDSTRNMAPEKYVSETSQRSNEQNAQNTSKIREKKSPTAKETKRGQTISVQQLLTDYRNLETDFKHISEKQLLEDLNLNTKSESLTTFSQSDVSFTSSKNLKSMKDVNSTLTTDCRSPRQSSTTDCQSSRQSTTTDYRSPCHSLAMDCQSPRQSTTTGCQSLRQSTTTDCRSPRQSSAMDCQSPRQSTATDCRTPRPTSTMDCRSPRQSSTTDCQSPLQSSAMDCQSPRQSTTTDCRTPRQTSTMDCRSPRQSSTTDCQSPCPSSAMDCRSPCQSSATIQGMLSKMDCPTKSMCANGSNVCGSDSGVNVVAKIDMLPFMGSHECEWESTSTDTWSFRLLHGRLRLAATLAHRHGNATRTQVRGDTPVRDIAVETVPLDRKNPVANMAVRFACEAMRFMVSHSLRATCSASDIPLLLRRCAAVSRVALRWGRAMHDAKLHLAYTLDNDGNLSLKVANIPLRSVWEVTARIELVLDDKCAVPWPRAADVRVRSVVSDVRVRDDDVRRAVAGTPHNWGHAPTTIWRIFRYLKHKTRDDELLLA